MQSKSKSSEEPKKTKTYKGCSFPVRNDFKEVKFKLSTVNLTPLKTVNLDVEYWTTKEWFEQPKNVEHHYRDVKFMIKDFGTFPFFKEQFIAINKAPERMMYDKGFIKYEFTLFTEIEFENPKLEVPLLFYDLIDEIYYNHFCEKEQFTKTA